MMPERMDGPSVDAVRRLDPSAQGRAWRITKMPKGSKATGLKRLPINSKITSEDLRQRWARFDEAEVAAIRTAVDLVMQVQAKYGLDKRQAQIAVAVWANGRDF
jgi:hypothetical protein